MGVYTAGQYLSWGCGATAKLRIMGHAHGTCALPVDLRVFGYTPRS